MEREKLFNRFQELSVKVQSLGWIVQNECTPEDVEYFKKESESVRVELGWLQDDVMDYYEKEGKKGLKIINTSFLYTLISKGYREFLYHEGQLWVSKGAEYEYKKSGESFNRSMYKDLAKLVHQEEGLPTPYGEGIRNSLYMLKTFGEDDKFRFQLELLVTSRVDE